MNDLTFLLHSKPHPVILGRVNKLYDEPATEEAKLVRKPKPLKNTLRRHILRYLQDRGRTEYEAMFLALNGRCLKKTYVAMIQDLRRSGAIDVINERDADYLRLALKD